MERPPEVSAKGGDTVRETSPISYSRDARTVNQTPSTPLLLNPGVQLDIPPDVPPPSYEEATGISPTAPSPVGSASSASAFPSSNRPPPPLPLRNASSATLAVPGAFPRPLSSGNLPAGGARRTSAGSNASVRMSASASVTTLPTYQNSAAAAVSGVYGGDSTKGRPPQGRPSTSTSGGAAGGVNNANGRPAAPGSIPRGRQFPATFNLYGDNWSRTYFVGEHQQTPLYAVRMRPTWQMTNPVIALHNGPNPDTAPLLAAVDYISMSDHMSVTLPPPLTYRGTGSTAVRLEIVMGWSHHYTFTMEVGTDPRNVHRETFEWRHSYGDAVAALGGTREGWKLVRMSTAALPGAPRPQPAAGFLSSDGREVVAMYSDARMSMTKQLKFAFVGTGIMGALGERWSVMAATSALGIWEKEEAVRSRR